MPVHLPPYFHSGRVGIAALVFAFAFMMAANQPARAQLFGTVSFSQISNTNQAYGATDINSCSVDLNNLITATVGGSTYQFAAYYDNSGNIWVARRSLGSSTWTPEELTTPGNRGRTNDITISPSLLSDDHNTIALAVDSTGDLNMSWGMHNVPLNYGISAGSVMGATFAAPSMTIQTAANDPTLFPAGDTVNNEATYPEFYNIPGSSNLLFAYRNGGAGGGSGNGDEYFNVYNPSTKTWTNNLVIDGESTSVNAYLNNLVYTKTGNNLLMSWTWRATPNWQTNSNIMFAQSPDNGATWFQQGGTTQYSPLPIAQNTSAGAAASSVGQAVVSIPQGDSFINQTSMTVDANNNPFIASYAAPAWTATSASSGFGNPNRQYMLWYYTGSTWKTSQVSDRTSDTSVDDSGDDVRDLGRPLVLIDSAGRVLLVTRSEDLGVGDFDSTAVDGAGLNNIVVYWNTVASLDSNNPMPWQSIALDSANMGESEPTYDSTLWNQYGILDLMYEPTDVNGSAAAQTVQDLEWNESAYFADLVPEPTSLTLLAAAAGFGLFRRSRRA